MAACVRGDRPTLGTASVASDSAFAAGELLYGNEHYAGASAVWSAALRHAQAAHDEPAEARTRTRLGLAERKLGNLKVAEGHERAAIDIKIRLQLTDVLSVSYNALGLVLLDANRNEEAAQNFQRAIETARAVDDNAGIAKASGNLALTYTYVGDPRARAGYRVLREAGRSLGDARFEGNGLANEAMADIWDGNPRPALARLDTARALYRTIGDETGEANALGQAASAFALTGEYDRAFAALDTALLISRRLGLKTETVRNLLQMAQLHTGLGDFRRAIRYFEQAATLQNDAGLEADHAAVLRGTAEAHLRLANVQAARTSAEKALRINTTAGELPGQLNDLLLLAELDFRAGGRARAAERLQASQVIAERLDTRGAHIAVALATASLASRDRDPQGVLAALRSAERDMAPGDYGAEWEAGALTARAYAQLGRLDSAASTGRRAVAAVERSRGTLASEALQATYVADRADVYGDLVLVLLRLGQTGEAFAIADRARSHELLDHMSALRASVASSASSAVPRELLDGDALLRRIDELVGRLRETERSRPRERQPTVAVKAVLDSELDTLRREYEDLLIRAARTNPRTTMMLGAQRLEPADISASLRSDELLVEYLITPGRLLLFAATKTGLGIVQTDLANATLSERVRLLRDLWGSPSKNWQNGLGTSRALHATLIAPLERAGLLRDITRLIIVPHGILGQVPFAALQDRGSERFLAQDFAISLLPSAASLSVLRRRSETDGVWAGEGEALAPFPDELPATAQEVEAFHASLPRTSRRVGNQATEAALRRALSGKGIVHVATHGIVNVHSPMFSRIELARSGESGTANDGRLEVHELFGVPIRSPLVFLSGCETGAALEWTDDPVKGTGDLTLAQAVLSAGAANVIFTLWRIDDAGAARFASRFYRLLQHVDVTQAVAQAQREMAVDPTWANPYYWAGYRLSGDGLFPGKLQYGARASVSRKTRPSNVATQSPQGFKRSTP